MQFWPGVFLGLIGTHFIKSQDDMSAQSLEDAYKDGCACMYS